MPDVESVVSSDGNREAGPMSSELAGDGENKFREVGDIILAGGRTLSFTRARTSKNLDKNNTPTKNQTTPPCCSFFRPGCTGPHFLR